MAAASADYDAVILGAGAAGMMCAAHAGARGGRVLVVDHAKAPGEKIRISGGGRCNFTNLYVAPEAFQSANPHFAKSALSRYTQYDFLDLIAAHGIAWHEKTLGQLFCDESARDVVRMLLDEMGKVRAELRLGTGLEEIEAAPDGAGFVLRLSDGPASIRCRNFVVATGGKSIPKMGASDMAYRLARQFGHAVTETRPALVPFTFGDALGARFKALAGVATPAAVTAGSARFEEALLFTHRGLSGPAILQASSYWREGEPIEIDLAPGVDLFERLTAHRSAAPKQRAVAALAQILPARLAADLTTEGAYSRPLAGTGDAALRALAESVGAWRMTPTGTEGYRTAEVTLGGVDVDGLSSKTMESRLVPNLYVIGEAADVTGWLGGYNFQWAWSSGWAAGTAIAESGQGG